MNIRTGPWLIAICMFLMAAAAAHALGGREDPLVRIDRLIDEQKYDEAILYVTDFMKNYPDRFDEGQRRLRRIIQLRSQFNLAGNELIDTIIKNPTDEEKKLAMIRIIEGIEANPSPAIREFIGATKDLSLFAYNRARFEQIMAEGAALIAEKNFAGAARAYASGFELYRPEFLATGIDQVSATAALATVDAVSGAIPAFSVTGAALSKAFDALARAYEAYPSATTDGQAAVDRAWPDAERAVLDFIALRREVVSAGRSLEAFFAAFSAGNPSATDSSFLPFASRLILGRRTEARLEGVAGAMDAQWTLALGGAQAALETAMANGLEAGRAAYDAGDWTAAARGFLRNEALARNGQALLALWAHYAPTDLAERSTTLGQAILASKAAPWLAMGHAASSAAAWASLAGLQASLDANAAALDGFDPSGLAKASALSAFAQRRQAFVTDMGSIQSLRDESGARAKALSDRTVLGYGSDTAAALQGELDGRIGQAYDRAMGLETRAVAAAASYEYGLLAAASESASALVAAAQTYMDGLPSDDPSLPEAIFYYPSKSLESLALADAALKALSREIGAFTAAYRAGPAYVASADSVVAWVERAASLGAATAAAIGRTAELSAGARERKRQADSARLEAERLVSESRSALRANSFETALERLGRARARYLSSLELEQNAALRAESDRTLTELAGAILKAQNDLVVADTRRLLTQGKSLYLAGTFDQAESLLLQAKARWSSTNTSPEAEVEYWLRLVQTALSVKTGRDIPVTAPLYTEMSQLLSLAKKYFEEGASLLAKGDKPGALLQFRLANQKINEVKVVFPLNQEARVLELKVEQLNDPDQYNQKFARMFAEARLKVQSGSADLATAYSDLKDLEAINPRYPGLRALIEQAEIKLGFRLPPPDPQAIRDSRTLTAAAQAIFDSRAVSRFAEARTQLDRALVLDPNNEAAARLKDKIATYIGGDAVVVLPSGGEALYNDAVNDFTRRDYINARIKLNRLLANYPQAAKVQKVLDLGAKLKELGYE